MTFKNVRTEGGNKQIALVQDVALLHLEVL